MNFCYCAGKEKIREMSSEDVLMNTHLQNIYRDGICLPKDTLTTFFCVKIIYSRIWKVRYIQNDVTICVLNLSARIFLHNVDSALQIFSTVVVDDSTAGTISSEITYIGATNKLFTRYINTLQHQTPRNFLMLLLTLLALMMVPSRVVVTNFHQLSVYEHESN